MFDDESIFGAHSLFYHVFQPLFNYRKLKPAQNYIKAYFLVSLYRIQFAEGIFYSFDQQTNEPCLMSPVDKFFEIFNKKKVKKLKKLKWLKL